MLQLVCSFFYFEGLNAASKTRDISKKDAKLHTILVKLQHLHKGDNYGIIKDTLKNYIG